MNQYFNLTRFGCLLRKHLAEHALSYLLSSAVLLGAMLVVMGFLAYVQDNPPGEAGQSALFILFMLGAGGYFASSAFGQFGAGRQAALALTLPASQVEKYLVAWLVSLPVFLGVFVAVFYAADWLIQALASHPQPIVNIFTLEAGQLLLIYLVVHGAALWGSIFFGRLQFVKTACLGLLMAAIIGFINYRVLKSLLSKDLLIALPLGDVRFQGGGALSLPVAQQAWLALVPLALAALLWAAAYARLTEKQL